MEKKAIVNHIIVTLIAIVLLFLLTSIRLFSQVSTLPATEEDKVTLASRILTEESNRVSLKQKPNLFVEKVK